MTTNDDSKYNGPFWSPTITAYMVQHERDPFGGPGIGWPEPPPREVQVALREVVEAKDAADELAMLRRFKRKVAEIIFADKQTCHLDDPYCEIAAIYNALFDDGEVKR